MSARHRFVIGLVGMTLMSGVMAAVWLKQAPATATFHGSLKLLLPTEAELPTWTVTYLPIAETPEMKAKVAEDLNYDDAVFAVYTNGASRLSVYIAYWTPGKMPYRIIAGHTPDVCWVGNGWACSDSRSNVKLADGTGGALPDAEQRTMLLNGHTEHVVFWHLLDGMPMSYGTQGLPPWTAMFSDVFTRQLHQRPEQVFIRISSPIPPERWTELAPYPVIAKQIEAFFRSKLPPTN